MHSMSNIAKPAVPKFPCKCPGDGARSVIKHHINWVRPLQLLGRILGEWVECGIVIKYIVHNDQQDNEPGCTNKAYNDLDIK